MRHPLQLLLPALLITSVILAGCQRFSAQTSNDPDAKLKYVKSLPAGTGLPMDNEKILLDAMTLFSARNDEPGLAEAWRTYGNFMISPAVEAHAAHYREWGFVDKHTWQTRYQGAVDYLEKARDLYAKNRRTDEVFNTELALAKAWIGAGNGLMACMTMARAEQLHAAGVGKVPPGVASLKEYLAPLKRRANCH